MTKLFTAMLGTETNTFSSLPTGMQLFEETCLFRGGAYGANVPMYASPLVVWRQMAESRGWHVTESLSAFATPAGKTVKSVYEQFRSEILRDLMAAMPVDAVLLSLHGAMVADGYDDAEGDLLMHVRHLVGPNVPIGVELDSHANVSVCKLENVTAMVLFREYPHIDIADRAPELFNIIADAVDGKTKPVMASFDCRTVGVFHTTRQPMRGFVDKCKALEGKDGILSISIVHGFPWADVPDMGSKILVIADKDESKAKKLAEQLGLEFFRMRKHTRTKFTSLKRAMTMASDWRQCKPLVIADVSDNAGAGAASDSTFIIRAMMKAKIKDAAVSMLWDPMAVRIACEVGEGAEVNVRIGGKLGPGSGNPLDVRAKIVGIKRNAVIRFGERDPTYTPVGDMAAFDVNGIAIICSTLRSQCKSTDCFTNVGIDPSKRQVIVVKSAQHFHAAFAPMAAEVVYVAAPGSVSPNFRTIKYANAPMNQWPFVRDPFE